MNPFVRLHSGKKFHYLNPSIKEIDLKDIVHSLSVIPRFNGHTRVPYYVLQHLCICHDAGPEQFRKELIGHDFGEYTMQDLPSPLKGLIPQYKEIEKRVETVIAKKFGFDFPYHPVVKEIDLTVLATEMRDLLSHGQDYKLLPYKPLKEKIIPWNTDKCRKEFMKRFNKLYNK